MTEPTSAIRPPEADPGTEKPFLRVTRGTPSAAGLSAAELAAIVAVLLDDEPSPDGHVAERRRSPWADPATVLRLHRRHPRQRRTVQEP